MGKWFLPTVLLLSATTVVNADTDYLSLLEAIVKYQDGYSDTNALKVICDVANSDVCDELRACCEGIYTLHMGATGDVVACREGFNAISGRYASSEVARVLAVLELFPEPCADCLGTGNTAMQKAVRCKACSNTGNCMTCGGYKRYKVCPNCDQRYTQEALVKMGYPNWDRVFCPNCQAKQAVKLNVTVCVDCKQSGICPQCQGAAGKTYPTCPVCKGKSKAVDSFAAQCGLERFCKDTRAALTKTVDCEKAYAQALKIGDPKKTLSALNECLEKYEGAYNLAVVLEARAGLSKQINDSNARRAEEDAMRLERERRVAEQKQRVLEEHQSFLSTVRQIMPKRVACVEIRKFLSENPDSPVIADARLLAAEMEAQLLAENKETRNRVYFGLGCLAFAGLAFLVWLVSCLKFVPPKKGRVPVATAENLQEGQNPPFSSLPAEPESSTNGQASPLVVYPVTVNTPEANMVACAECGALMDCPPSVSQQIVICSSCKKAFLIH